MRKVVALSILAIVLTAGLVPLARAQSQQPAPTPVGTSQEPGPTPKDEQRTVGTDQRENESAPSIIKRLPRAETSQEPQPAPKDEQQIIGRDQRENETAPSIIKKLPPSDVGKDNNQTEKNVKKSSPDWWLTWFTGALAIVALLQCVLLFRQEKVLKRSVVVSEKSVEVARKSALAMEDVAKSIAVSAQASIESVATSKDIAAAQRSFGEMQLRPYLSVIPGNYIPQDREIPYKAEIIMIVRNTGNTPAHEVKFAIRVKIMPFPLPDEVDLSMLRFKDDCVSSGDTASGQQFFIRAWLDSLISDAEIEEFTKGNDKKLYVYGTIWYKDSFGKSHHSNFCQIAMWDVKGVFSTININRHNDVT